MLNCASVVAHNVYNFPTNKKQNKRINRNMINTFQAAGFF